MSTGQSKRGSDRLAAYRAARGFLERRPWKVLTDTDWFHVVVEGEPDGMVASVLGNAGREYGLGLFRGPNAESHLRRMMSGEPVEEGLAAGSDLLNLLLEKTRNLPREFLVHVRKGGVKPTKGGRVPILCSKPPHRSMNPAEGRDLSVLWRALAACNHAWDRGWLESGWPATDGARPVLRVIDNEAPGEEANGPHGAVGFKVELALAPSGESQRLATKSSSGELLMESSHEEPPVEHLDGFDFYDDDLEDEESFEAYADHLVELFGVSPEYAALPENSQAMDDARLFIDYLRNYCWMSPAEMSAGEVEEVVFEIVPAKVSMEPQDASDLLKSLRALFRFIGRQFQYGPAKSCERVIGASADARLKRLLADPAMFGMAKSFFMQGKARGFDMTSSEGLQAWQDEHNALQDLNLPSDLKGVPAPRPSARRSTVESRNARKRARRKQRQRSKKKRKGGTSESGKGRRKK